MNMSYCRFNNTAIDLADCLCVTEEFETLTDLRADLSCNEYRAAERLYSLCQQYAECWEELKYYNHTTEETEL